MAIIEIYIGKIQFDGILNGCIHQIRSRKVAISNFYARATPKDGFNSPWDDAVGVDV
jgi:hypothetical protein